jgi:hypothetical protein
MIFMQINVNEKSQVSYFGRDGTRQFIIVKENILQVAHVSYRSWYYATETIIRQHKVNERSEVSYFHRNGTRESVPVKINIFQVAQVSYRRRDGAIHGVGKKRKFCEAFQ